MGQLKSYFQYINMKLLAIFVALVIAVVSAEPEADAWYGYGGYGYGGYRGKRSADADAYYGYGGYYGRGYGYGGYGYGGYRGKRSADAEPEADATAVAEAAPEAE